MGCDLRCPTSGAACSVDGLRSLVVIAADAVLHSHRQHQLQGVIRSGPFEIVVGVNCVILWNRGEFVFELQFVAGEGDNGIGWVLLL